MAEAVPNRNVVRFGKFEVDLRAGEMRKGKLKLRLSGQPFQVLAMLLERPGEVVTREELQRRLWPDTFVDVEHNLNTAINKIREVLGDSADSQVIWRLCRGEDIASSAESSRENQSRYQSSPSHRSRSGDGNRPSLRWHDRYIYQGP